MTVILFAWNFIQISQTFHITRVVGISEFDKKKNNLNTTRYNNLQYKVGNNITIIISDKFLDDENAQPYRIDAYQLYLTLYKVPIGFNVNNHQKNKNFKTNNLTADYNNTILLN